MPYSNIVSGAGIPTAPGGSVGQRLRLCLKHRPHEFVSVLLSELQSAFHASGSSGSRRSAARKGSDSTEATRRAILEDILYFWMLAEAYVQHPAIQADMRCEAAAWLSCFDAMVMPAVTSCIRQHACNAQLHLLLAGLHWGGPLLCRWTTRATSSTGALPLHCACCNP
jgi:hypothetical protein